MLTTAAKSLANADVGDPLGPGSESLPDREPSRLQELTGKIASILAATLLSLVIFFLLASRWP